MERKTRQRRQLNYRPQPKNSPRIEEIRGWHLPPVINYRPQPGQREDGYREGSKPSPAHIPPTSKPTPDPPLQTPPLHHSISRLAYSQTRPKRQAAVATAASSHSDRGTGKKRWPIATTPIPRPAPQNQVGAGMEVPFLTGRTVPHAPRIGGLNATDSCVVRGSCGLPTPNLIPLLTISWLVPRFSVPRKIYLISLLRMRPTRKAGAHGEE